MKRIILVNGVPASGKSTVARAISDAGKWPLLALDTIKEALFVHLGTGDRDYNRLLGRASYHAMFDLVSRFPDGMTVVLDAWFGFQPEEVLLSHQTRAGVSDVLQVWCYAPPAEIGGRYRARVEQRSEGHLGLEYVAELVALAERAKPIAGCPTYPVETTRPFDVDRFMNWLEAQAPDGASTPTSPP